MISLAADRGIKLLFSGWGGDDFINIEVRGIEIDLLRSLKFGEFFKRIPVRPFRKLAKYFFIYVIYRFFDVLPSNVSIYLGEKSLYLKKNFMKSDRRSLRYFYCYRSWRQLHLRLIVLFHIQDRCESWAMNG